MGRRCRRRLARRDRARGISSDETPRRPANNKERGPAWPGPVRATSPRLGVTSLVTGPLGHRGVNADLAFSVRWCDSPSQNWCAMLDAMLASYLLHGHGTPAAWLQARVSQTLRASSPGVDRY